MNQTTSQFNSILSGFADHYVSHSELERLKETLKPSYIKLKKTWIPKKHRLYNDAQTFLSIYPKMDDVVKNIVTGYTDSVYALVEIANGGRAPLPSKNDEKANS